MAVHNCVALTQTVSRNPVLGINGNVKLQSPARCINVTDEFDNMQGFTCVMIDTQVLFGEHIDTDI